MIDIVVGSAGAGAAEVVVKAFERSYTRGQIRIAEGPRDSSQGGIVVVLAPTDSDADWLEAFVRKPCKIVLLGKLGPAISALAGISLSPMCARLIEGASCAPAPAHHMTASKAAIVYAAHGLGASSPLRRRHFCRFDFNNEWNNLGYGRIDVGNDPWSIVVTARPRRAAIVGELVLANDALGGAIATLSDTPTASILWFARPAGPVDGADWRIVEAFISDHRDGSLPCRPHLRDVPHGVAAAVTMRLDCDEAVTSARPLLDFYRSRGLPLSVAVATGQPECPASVDLLVDVKAAGGSVLSHSASHPPDWGGTPEAAEAEARASKSWLETRVPGVTVRYAVSPFHQNPSYVPQALARAGYHGFVGGIICSDPEYLMARGGAVPYGPGGFISHSQSCMLHGDCMLADGDPLRVYRQAFRTARLGGQFFGYLDHPFSPRYGYGWTDEAHRLSKHAEFLDAMIADCATESGPLLFVNEDTCLDFMREKAATEIAFDPGSGEFEVSRHSAAGLPLSIGFRGRNRAATDD
jgi:hypothetical protein